MSVLDRKELEQSPLADLHTIAAELGVEGFRRLKREDLIDTILGDSGGGGDEAVTEVRRGTLDVLPNGSGFMRSDAFAQSRDDVYVSPAQIRRCELRAGDEISGPVRSPRRSERHPSLVRVETVNGAPAEPPADRLRFADLTAV